MTEPARVLDGGFEHGHPRKVMLPALTSLRFFAATEVVIFHFFFPAPTTVLGSLFSAGYQAVTFFFVLSGFILAYVYSGRREEAPSATSARRFWAARAGRILPGYALGLLLGLPLLLYGTFVSHIVPRDKALASLVLTPLLLQSFWPVTAEMWNSPSWSLSVEMVFYALFPLLLRLAAKVRPFLLLGLSYALLTITQLVRAYCRPQGLDGTGADWDFYKFFPAFHLATFLFGLALGRVFLFRPRLGRASGTLLFLAALAIMTAILGLRTRLPVWASGDAVLALVFGAIICAAASPGPLLAPLTSPKLVLLGEASYAMYILHYPLMFWWHWTIHDKAGVHLSPFVDFGLFLALVIGLSVATHIFLERPLRDRIVRAFGRARLVAAYA
jgi:peptidoglycan/LPS O-acetylase OafA/YrhL